MKRFFLSCQDSARAKPHCAGATAVCAVLALASAGHIASRDLSIIRAAQASFRTPSVTTWLEPVDPENALWAPVLRNNPFQIVAAEMAPVAEASEIEEEPPPAPRVTAADFRVTAVVVGTRTTAVINGRLVREGDVLDGLRVISIHDDGVSLDGPDGVIQIGRAKP